MRYLYVTVLPATYSQAQVEQIVGETNVFSGERGLDWMVLTDQGETETSFWWLPIDDDLETLQLRMLRLVKISATLDMIRRDILLIDEMIDARLGKIEDHSLKAVVDPIHDETLGSRLPHGDDRDRFAKNDDENKL